MVKTKVQILSSRMALCRGWQAAWGLRVLHSTMSKAPLTHSGELTGGIRIEASSEEAWSLPRWRWPSPQPQSDQL